MKIKLYWYLSVIGLALLIYGIILLIPVGAWAQSDQREAMMNQMTGAILPSMTAENRLILLSKVLTKLAIIKDDLRKEIIGRMVRVLFELPEHTRREILSTQMKALNMLEEEKRNKIMRTMSEIL